MSYKIAISFIFLSIVWGSSFMFMRIGVPEMSAPVFGGLRVAIAGLALLPILLKPKHLTEYRANWLKLSLIGVIGTGTPFMLLAFAAYELNAGTSAVMNSSVPMLTGFIAHIFFKDYLTKQQIIGLAIGIIGVVALMYDGITSGTQSAPWAFGIAMIAFFCYAIGSNLAKHYLSGISPLTIASSGLITSGIIGLPIALLYFPEHAVSWKAWGSLITTALLSTSAAMIVFYNLIQEIGPTKTTTVTLIIPLVAVFLGTTFLKEQLTYAMLVGAAIVLIGTTLTMFAKKQAIARE